MFTKTNDILVNYAIISISYVLIKIYDLQN